MSMSNRGRVPWSNKLRRLHADVPHKAEWMAPESVVNRVRADYRATLDWLHDSVLRGVAYQWRSAPQHLSGAYLKRYRATLKHQRQAGQPACAGVLRADHRLEVRRFSEDGECCLVIDYQTQRRMATYDSETQARLHTQDMGDCVLVYQMVYDAGSQRWKLDKFVQQLPSGWGKPGIASYIELLADLPAAVGRDH